MWTSGTATDAFDLLDRLNTYLTAKGSAFGLTYAGTGNGTLTAYSGGASAIAETFTITATSATSFDVVGSVSGSIGPATVGTPFAHALIEFTITAGGTAFVASDEFTLTTAPKWTTMRREMGCLVNATQGNSGQYSSQNLVDGKNARDESRRWKVEGPVTMPQDIVFTFREAVTLDRYHLATFSAPVAGILYYAPSAWDFQYWNGSAWVTLDSQSGHAVWGDNEIKQFTVSSPVSATQYRLHITATYEASTRIGLGAVRLFRQGTNIDAAFAAMIWKAPGNDGASEIYCGVHPFERGDVDYQNWELADMTGYTAAGRFYGQAGFHGKLYLPLWNQSIPYRFVVDGRRCIVLTRVNTTYGLAILGLHEPYLSPGQLPYPQVLGGCMAFGATLPTWESASWRFSNTTNNHRMPTHSDNANVGSPTAEQYQCRARNLDGSWNGYEATANDDVSVSPGSKHILWPYRCGVSLSDVDLDGTYTLWPVMLMNSAPLTIGQLPGIAYVTGQGLTAETLIRKGAIDWMAIPNITRTDRDDWCAVALD